MSSGLPIHSPQFTQAINDHLRRTQEGDDDPEIIGFLNDARKTIAEFWLVTNADQVGSGLSRDVGRSHALLAGSVADITDEAPPHWLAGAMKTLEKGPGAEGFAPAVLAASLYRRADQLPLPVTLEPLRADFMEHYLRFILAQPLVFTRVGEVDAYYAYLKKWVDLLHGSIPGDPHLVSDAAKHAAACFAQFHNFIPLYFCESDLKEINSKRADLIEFVLQSSGLATRQEPPPRSPERKRLRLGILAAHFAPQTETFHTLPYYEHVDREKVEVVLFTLQVSGHPAERYCFSRADRVAPLSGSLTEQVEAIRREEVDVLAIATNVGALTHGLTLLASHRLARMQFTLVSSPATTGMRHMDFFVSGTLSEPQDAQRHYREKLMLLEGSGFCFAYAADPTPPAMQPTRADFGIPDSAVVFVSGANYYKIIPETIEAWARIIAAVPGSRLLLYPFGPAWSNYYPSAPFMRQIYGAFVRQGLGTDRLIVLPSQPNRATVKECLKLCDVYLDSLRHAGGHSLVDPLEVGLPSISLEGPLLRSRHGAGILRSLKLDGLVATDLAGYERLAVELGHDAVSRTRWRQRVIAAMRDNPLFLDSRRFGAMVTQLYVQMASA